MLLLVFDPKKDAQSQSEFGTDQKQKKDQTKKDDQKTDMWFVFINYFGVFVYTCFIFSWLFCILITFIKYWF